MVRILPAFLLLLLVPPAACAQDKAPTVVRITFDGNKRYTDAYLKEQIATKEGQPLDAGLLTGDQRILREFFASVLDVRELEVEGGVEVVFEVLDQILVGDVKVLGQGVDKSDFAPLLSTRRRRPLLEYSLQSDKDLIERVHREQGYYFVSVQVRRVATQQANVQDVVFQVIPNNQVKVTEVILEGANSLDHGDLLDPLESPGWASKLRARDRNRRFDSGTIVRVLIAPYTAIRKLLDTSYYRRETVDEDRRKLEAFYREEGFLNARVVLVGVRFDDKRRSATVHYRIDEGARFTVRKVLVKYTEGGLPKEADRAWLSEKALLGLATFGKGDPYRGRDVTQTLRSIRERVWGRAYAQSSVGLRVHTVAGKTQVDITYEIAAGEKVRIGQLRFIGNRYTRDNVIRRQFREGALPGDFLDIEALQAGMQRLNSLQYFRFVRFARQRQWGLIKSAHRDKPDEYDVEIEVEELDRTRQLQVGGSVSTDGGAAAQLEITWRNFDITRTPTSFWDILSLDAFRGGGQQFTLSVSPGTRNSTFSISFTDPALRDSRWSLHTRLFRTLSRESPDYDLTSDGIVLRVGRYLGSRFRWHLSGEWSLRQVLLDEAQFDAPVNALDQQGTSSLHGIAVSLRRIARREADRFLNGHVSTLRAQVYGLGADVEVVKGHFEHSAGFKLWRNQKGHHRIRFNFTVDWATAYGGTPELPIYERYFLGGRNLRGFEFREVGPRSNGRPTGGEFMVRFITQYTIPLLGAEDGIGIDLVVFVDQGGIATEFNDWNSDSWRIGAGFGLAISFELGGAVQPPLLIDFGFPVRKQDGDRKRLVSVSFVRFF